MLPCQRTAHTAEKAAAVLGRESLYGTVMGTHTHTLGDPKPSDQGHTVTPYKHRYTHPDKEKHTKHRNTEIQTHR